MNRAVQEKRVVKTRKFTRTSRMATYKLSGHSLSHCAKIGSLSGVRTAAGEVLNNVRKESFPTNTGQLTNFPCAAPYRWGILGPRGIAIRD
jgi:hypothetical protein